MFLTDEEMEEIESKARPEEAQQLVHQPPPQAPQPVQLYPLSIAQAPGPNGAVPNGAVPNGINGAAPPPGWALRQYGGVPVWAWGLMTLAGGAAGYFFWRGRGDQPSPNDPSSSPAPSVGEAIMAAPEQRGGWRPSRTTIVGQLERYLQKKGASSAVKIWLDADDARDKGKLAHVSPLVNLEVTGKTFKVDQAFTRFCRREGLNPVQHADGNIGLYPHSTKRGKEWEEYVDALRDEGQKV